MKRKTVEYVLCVLLALASTAHLAGTFAGYDMGTEVFVWSLSATAFGFAIVFLHVLRINRPDDQTIRYGAIVFTLIWVVVALMFGASQGSVFDPRGLIHAIISLGLVWASLMRHRREPPLENASQTNRSPV